MNVIDLLFNLVFFVTFMVKVKQAAFFIHFFSFHSLDRSHCVCVFAYMNMILGGVRNNQAFQIEEVQSYRYHLNLKSKVGVNLEPCVIRDTERTGAAPPFWGYGGGGCCLLVDTEVGTT